jgi:hypothetical protein
MQQRQPRLGDILDDYCPRERRVTNHAVVAMVGEDVKQTRCTTCDAEHDYKHAKVPRQRKKSDSPAVLYAQVLAGGPKKVAHEPVGAVAAPPSAIEDRGDGHHDQDDDLVADSVDLLDEEVLSVSDLPQDDDLGDSEEAPAQPAEEGPVHRRLIRAQLPRIEGQPPPARQAPDFTIRQPAGPARVNRFRPRNARGAGGGGGQFQGPSTRFNGGGNGNSHGGPMRSGSQGHGSQGNGSSGRPPMVSRLAKRQGPGRKRSK